MSFYEWSQNNSGGSFNVNDNVTHRVIIEADSYEEAEEKASELGIYYNGVASGWDCSCCGDRWYDGEEVDLPLETSIREYAQHLADEYGWEEPDAYIYYKTGVKESIYMSKE